MLLPEQLLLKMPRLHQRQRELKSHQGKPPAFASCYPDELGTVYAKLVRKATGGLYFVMEAEIVDRAWHVWGYLKRPSCRFPLQFGEALTHFTFQGYEPDQNFLIQSWPAVKATYFPIPEASVRPTNLKRHMALRAS